MEYIYVVSEDSHGDIAFSLTLAGIYNYLIKTNWINKNTEIWVDDDSEITCSLEEKFGYSEWAKAIENMDLDTFNALFDPCFQIRTEPLVG